MILIPPFLIALFLSLVLTPVATAALRRTPLVDLPDNSGLKIHRAPIVNAGGIVVAAVTVPLALVFMPLAGAPIRSVSAVVCGLLLSMVLGLVDDLRPLRPATRLAAEALLGLSVAAAGLTPALFPWPFLSSLLTVLIVVGAINAVNLLDGMDGLATGVAAICCGAFASVAAVRGETQVLLLALVTGAAFLGFLPYNFHPASIFLGNSGSCLTGFLLAVLMILVLSASFSLSGLAGTLLIVGLPLSDTVYAIVRRLKAGRGIMVGDRDHFYDKLLRKGFSQRESALISYGVSLLFAASGIAILIHQG